MKVIAVIPAHNEGERIRSALADVCQYVDQVIVVDDGSTDDTARQAKEINPKVVVLSHRTNLGKGAALKTGSEAALRLGTDVILFLDSDGQHQTFDIPQILHTLEQERVDIVFGSRKFGKDAPLMMLFGNRFLSAFITLLFRVSLSDTQTGFRAFRADVYKKLEWFSPGYDAETEMIVNVSRHHLTFREVPVSTVYTDKYKGTTIFDGLRIFMNLLLWRLL